MGRDQKLSKLREACEFKDRCGRIGHYQRENGDWARCRCLQLELNERKLGLMYTEKIEETSNLAGLMDKNLLLTGPLATLRRHVARVLLDMAGDGQDWVTMDAYRLIEIFLDQDTEFETVSAATSKDLLILLLGFGDPPNKYLPELLLQAINRRELLRLPTWVILGLGKERIAGKYTVELADKLGEFLAVGVR